MAWPGLSLIITWSVSGASEGRRINCGGSEGVVNVLKKFTETKKTTNGRVSGVYRLFCSVWNDHQWSWEGD